MSHQATNRSSLGLFYVVQKQEQASLYDPFVQIFLFDVHAKRLVTNLLAHVLTMPKERYLLYTSNTRQGVYCWAQQTITKVKCMCVTVRTSCVLADQARHELQHIKAFVDHSHLYQKQFNRRTAV